MHLAGHFAVQSSKGEGFYLVNGECTCPDGQWRGKVYHGWCKHTLAVELFKDTLQDTTEDSPSDEELEAMARHYGHYVPGDPPSRGKDGRSPAEQLRDLY